MAPHNEIAPIARIALCACVAFLASSALALTAVADEPTDVLAAWTTSLANADHPAYLDCLHGGAQSVPEYGSPEAMTFWQAQIAQLEDQGFAGAFEIVSAPAEANRLPPGALLAYPIVDTGPIDEAIVLIQEAGSWKILRLFS